MEPDWNFFSSPASSSISEPQGSANTSTVYPPGSRPCVVCKNVHLSCDRARPCSRCVRIGREADCVDPPEAHRGRSKASDGPIKRKPKHDTKPKSDLSMTPQLTFTNHPQLAGAFGNSANGERPAAPTDIEDIGEQMAEGRVWYYYTRTVILGCTQELASYLGYQIHELIGLPSTVLEPPEVIINWNVFRSPW